MTKVKREKSFKIHWMYGSWFSCIESAEESCCSKDLLGKLSHCFENLRKPLTFLSPAFVIYNIKKHTILRSTKSED